MIPEQFENLGCRVREIDTSVLVGAELANSSLTDAAGDFKAGQIVYLRLIVDGGMLDHDGEQCAAVTCVNRHGRPLDGPEMRHYVVPVKYLVASKLVAEEMG